MVKSHQPALLWHHFYYHACDFIAKTNDCGCFRCCTACTDLPLTLSLPLFSSPLSLSLSLSLCLSDTHTHTHASKHARTHSGARRSQLCVYGHMAKDSVRYSGLELVFSGLAGWFYELFYVPVNTVFT